MKGFYLLFCLDGFVKLLKCRQINVAIIFTREPFLAVVDM